MFTAYVFDITGEMVTQATDAFESNAIKKAAQSIGVYGNVQGQWIRVSTDKIQHCIDQKYFISLNKKFKVDYIGENQNPLRYAWRGSPELAKGESETESGIVHANELRNINQHFLKVFQCFNPYLDNSEISEIDI